MGLEVWVWQKITKDELIERNTNAPKICVVGGCGKEVHSEGSTLCKGHHIAYHRWVNKKTRKKYAFLNDENFPKYKCPKCGQVYQGHGIVFLGNCPKDGTELEKEEQPKT